MISKKPYLVGAAALMFSLLILRSSSTELASPPKNSPLRKQLLDIIRPKVEEVFGEKVIFVVRGIIVENDHALLFVVPVKPDGKNFSTQTVKVPPNSGIKRLDSNGWVFALLKREQGVWKPLGFDFNYDVCLDQYSAKIAPPVGCTNEFDRWKKKYPELGPQFFETVEVATNADGLQ